MSTKENCTIKYGTILFFFRERRQGGYRFKIQKRQYNIILKWGDTVMMLELVTKEYLSIVETLTETEVILNGRIVIEKERFKSLLEKYQYMKFRDKVKIYKDLNFIIHDKNNYTLPVREHEKTVRKVVINYNAYITLKHLYETIVN